MLKKTAKTGRGCSKELSAEEMISSDKLIMDNGLKFLEYKILEISGCASSINFWNMDNGLKYGSISVIFGANHLSYFCRLSFFYRALQLNSFEFFRVTNIRERRSHPGGSGRRLNM
ncbi:hypothetical protein ACJX0J_007797, partial [Zea mays]